MCVHVVYGSESEDRIVKFDSTATAADVLHMAVEGVLYICTMSTICVLVIASWLRTADRTFYCLSPMWKGVVRWADNRKKAENSF